jgi:peptide/nickel transport system substrate-binding protein
LLVACANAATGHAATLRWANDGDAGSMDPYSRNETVQLSMLGNIYEPLIRRDAKLDLEPGLARSWKQTAPTTWRFHLRPGVRWQDGSAFTAADVAFSLARIQSPASLLRATLASVTGARVIDDLTIDLDTATVDPILPQELTTWLIMSQAWCRAHDAETPAQIAAGTENFATRNAMGTGPFSLTLREPDRRTVMQANMGWWDKPAHNLDRAEFSVIANGATRVAALLSGEIDMIYAVPPQDNERLGHTPGVKLITGPELRTIFLGLDQSRDELLSSDVKGRNPLRDVRVREAFVLAIDEQAIAARVMRGQARPSWEMWGPGINGFNPALDHRPAADPARARALMAEAGYPDGFTITLDCPNDRYVNDEAICTAIVPMLARIGVKVTLNARTKAKYFSEIGPPAYRTDFYLLGWTPTTYDAHNALYNLVIARKLPRGEINYGGYASPEIDRLTDRIAAETDPASRQQMIDAAAAVLQRDHGYIPLHQQVLAWAARSNVELTQMADNYFPLRLVQVK